MHLLLYMIAVLCVLISGSAVYMGESLATLAFGSLAAVLFGVMGKVCQTLDSIDSHLSQLSKMPTQRISNALTSSRDEFRYNAHNGNANGASDAQHANRAH